MLTIPDHLPAAVIDGYLHYVAHCLYTKDAPRPIGFDEWHNESVDSKRHLTEIIDKGLMYCAASATWKPRSKNYQHMQLVCSAAPQPRVATVEMESSLTDTSRYLIKYKSTGYRVNFNPEITHDGETKTLQEWAKHLDVDVNTMQIRFRKYQRNNETTGWLVRPRYAHGKVCAEQA